MKLLVKGKELPYLSLTVSENINQYYSTVEVVVPLHLEADELTLKQKDDLELHVLSQEFAGDAYKVTCCSKEAYRLLNAVTNPVFGNYNIEGVCDEAGIPCTCLYSSATTEWLLPSMKLYNFIAAINRYGWHENGGGCRCFLDLTGKLYVIDMKSAYESKVTDFVGEILADQSNSEWYINNPGVIDITTFAGLKIEQSQISIEENCSRAHLRINDTTGSVALMKEHQLRNEFYFAKYMARSLTANNNGSFPVHIGKTYGVKNMSPLICTGYSYTDDGAVVDGGPASVKIKFNTAI